MHERFIVNLRVPPAVLGARLPGRLRPQVVNSWSVVSFCLLDLRCLTLGPLPPVVGPRSMSCAVRAGVLDESGTASVFVPERATGSRLGSAVTRLGFSAPHRLVEIRMSSHQETTELIVGRGGSTELDCRLQTRDPIAAEVFADVEEFAAFVAAGERSYGLSRHDGQLTVLDLHKSDAGYEPLGVERFGGSFIDEWTNEGGELDSAMRTADARYEWTYHGLVPDGGAAAVAPAHASGPVDPDPLIRALDRADR